MMLFALFFLLACLIQPWVAADPVLHVLAQFPLLAAAGYVLPVTLRLNRAAVGPTLIIGLVFIAIWMLPRSVDAALGDPLWHIGKFVTIPLAIGLPLRLSWGRIGLVLQGILKAQAVSMLLLLGFLYTHAPVRICNSYLINDQIQLGYGFVYAAAGLAILWIIPAFLGHPLSLSTKGSKHESSVIRH